MNRGSVVIAADRGEFTGKPRPFVIVQRATSIAESTTLTVCPLTTGLIGAGPIRILVQAHVENGLDDDSEVEVALLTTIRKRRVRQVIGELDLSTMTRLDVALTRWLDL